MKVLVTQNARIFGSESRNVEAGEVLELDAELAADLINSGNAEMVAETTSAPAAASEEAAPEVLATQAALDHAEAVGVDISTIAGSGAGGKVLKSDVEAAVAAKEGA